MTARPPAPQAISALLRKAGFKRASRRIYTEGFVVQAHDPGTVRVAWQLPPGEEWSRERQTEAIHRLARVIEGQGWRLWTAADLALIVTAKEG